MGGGRVYRSNQCYDQMPTLVRETHSRDANGKTWRTRCTTPPNDPRKAILNTLVVAQTDTHIDLIETGRYEIVLETGRCVADVKRTRTYNLVAADKPAASAAPAPPPAPEPAPKPEPKPGGLRVAGRARRASRCGRRRSSSAPARRSSSAALVLDDKGCATRTPTTWKLQAGAPPGVTVDSKGLVTIGSDVPEGTRRDRRRRRGQGDARQRRGDLARPLRRSARELGPQRVRRERRRGRRDDRIELDRRGRRPRRGSREDASLGLHRHHRRRARRPRRARGGAPRALAARGRARARGRRSATRPRSPRCSSDGASARSSTPSRSALMRRASPRPRPRARSRKVAARAVGRSDDVSEVRARLRAADDVLPDRRREPVPASRRRSAADLPAPAAIASTAPPKRGKICPTCGDRFDGAADFCGKDGTQLVLN